MVQVVDPLMVAVPFLVEVAPFLVEVPSRVEVAPSEAAGVRRIAVAAPSKAAGDRRIAVAVPSKAAGDRRIAVAAPSKAAGDRRIAVAAPYQVARRSFVVVELVMVAASMHAFLLASHASLLLPFAALQLLQLESAVPHPCAILVYTSGIEIFFSISAVHMKEPSTYHRLLRSEAHRTPDTFFVGNSL